MDRVIDHPPEWQVEVWLNCRQPITLAGLRGRVVALHTFQMLCPGCVSHGLPQAMRIRQTFAEADVAVIGLHTVFEHHAVMTRPALEAFVHEYGWDFPIGIDRPARDGDVPQTMAAYAMRGTPSLLLFDRRGRLRHHAFGRLDDMLVGARVMALVAERSDDVGGESRLTADEGTGGSGSGGCTEEGCVT